MRSQDNIEIAQRTLENRLEDAEHQFTIVFNAPKRDALAAIRDGTAPEQIVAKMDQRFVDPELQFQEFLVAMAMKNAASWAQGDLDSI